MTDHDALVRAICEYPDDDTPRLIYADFLEEHGEADRAAFVRAQVELARTPPWEPFAALCRHRRPEWSAEGAPFREALPALPAVWGVEWHERPFRRGLGWRMAVRSLVAWNEVAPRLFQSAPLGELDVYAMDTLDDWREFASAEWARNLRVLHLLGTSPAEPVRALRETPQPPPLTDVYFHRSTSPGLGFTVSDLLKSPLYVTLRGLHFRVGGEGVEDLIDAVTHDSAAHERLTLAGMGLTPELVRRWCDRGGPRGLTELDLRGNASLGDLGAAALVDGLRHRAPGLTTLGLSRCGLRDSAAEALAGCEALAGVRQLDLSLNLFSLTAVQRLGSSSLLVGLRSLDLSHCGLGSHGVAGLPHATFWPNLVELDLRGNPFDDYGARHLLDIVPPDLTALLLDGDRFEEDTRAALRAHFGDRVILDGGEP